MKSAKELQKELTFSVDHISRSNPEMWTKAQEFCEAYKDFLSVCKTERECVSHIIEMAHNLDITVCIEGIENVEEQDKICKLLPDTMQGYLYGRPVPAQEFTEINISRYISN